MLLRPSVPLLACALLACGRGPAPHLNPSCGPAGPGLAAVRARVLDASTGAPIPYASVTTDSWRGGESDPQGIACVASIDAGTEGVRVEEPGYRTQRVVQAFVAGAVVSLEFRLVRADPPCCRLRGTWRIRLDLAERGSLGPDPTSRRVVGTVVFDPRIPNPLPGADDLFDPFVETEFGRHRVDLGPSFGGPVATDASAIVVGGGGGGEDGETMNQEVVGFIPVRDSVRFTFIPRMIHGSIHFSGRIEHDTIRGIWQVNGFTPRTEGSFVMHRIPPDAHTAGVVEEAAAAQERALRREVGDEKGWGLLRLRTFDRARSRLVSARYRVVSMDTEALPTAVGSRDGGAGPVVPVLAGDHAVDLVGYACGSRMYHADRRARTAPTLRIHIPAGKTTTRTVTIDSRRITPAASFENPEGLQCDP